MLNKINILISLLQKHLNYNNIITSSKEIQPYLYEQRNNFMSESTLVLTPTTPKEVSVILNLCNRLKIGVVPLSGNTGLVGGGVATPKEVIISTEKLNKVREIDPVNYIVILESGVKLEEAILLCKKYNLLFPLDLPSRKKACIGGNLATNAGGLNTIKYGQTKHFTLGIEIVLPNGDIITDLNKLTKRNIGPDYKNLFIGSEGILGIITAASFKLVPLPQQTINILISVKYIKQLIDIYLNFKKYFFTQISAFEAINKNAIHISLEEYKNSFFPISKNNNWFALITLDYYINDPSNLSLLKKLLKKLQNNQQIVEYYLENNSKQLWQVRDNIPKAQSLKGMSIKHDIAIPLSNMSNFIEEAIFNVQQLNKNAVPIIFGHMGDESLHFNFSPNITHNNLSLLNSQTQIKEIMLNLIVKYNGNFSAEHGIGILHKDNLKKYYFNSQYYMLKLLKQMLDPNNILNPNKILNF